MGWHTAWFSEIQPYACRVLEKHWPNVPNYGDITSIKGDQVEQVEMLVGGFPCQDISVAGKGAGLSGARSGLWFHYARLIEEIQPRWVVAENVAALRTRGLDTVLGSLTTLGYDAEWHCIPASYVGAPQPRERIWIVAYPHGQCIEPVLDRGGQEGSGPFAPARSLDLMDADCRAGAGWSWATEPGVGRVAHGIPAYMDRLRCLGNAIVPQVAYLIFQAIQARESGLSHIQEVI